MLLSYQANYFYFYDILTWKRWTLYYSTAILTYLNSNDDLTQIYLHQKYLQYKKLIREFHLRNNSNFGKMNWIICNIAALNLMYHWNYSNVKNLLYFMWLNIPFQINIVFNEKQKWSHVHKILSHHHEWKTFIFPKLFQFWFQYEFYIS